LAEEGELELETVEEELGRTKISLLELTKVVGLVLSEITIVLSIELIRLSKLFVTLLELLEEALLLRLQGGELIKSDVESLSLSTKTMSSSAAPLLVLLLLSLSSSSKLRCIE